MLSRGAMRILKELADDEDCDLISEGIVAYCGSRPVAARVVHELVWSSAVEAVAPSERGARYYMISNMGRCYLRRPELADEYREWIMCRRGSFTVKDDRIVPLKD